MSEYGTTNRKQRHNEMQFTPLNRREPSGMDYLKLFVWVMLFVLSIGLFGWLLKVTTR